MYLILIKQQTIIFQASLRRISLIVKPAEINLGDYRLQLEEIVFFMLV